jgi:hypothetical protein
MNEPMRTLGLNERWKIHRNKEQTSDLCFGSERKADIVSDSVMVHHGWER